MTKFLSSLNRAVFAFHQCSGAVQDVPAIDCEARCQCDSFVQHWPGEVSWQVHAAGSSTRTERDGSSYSWRLGFFACDGEPKVLLWGQLKSLENVDPKMYQVFCQPVRTCQIMATWDWICSLPPNSLWINLAARRNLHFIYCFHKCCQGHRPCHFIYELRQIWEYLHAPWHQNLPWLSHQHEGTDWNLQSVVWGPILQEAFP